MEPTAQTPAPQTNPLPAQAAPAPQPQTVEIPDSWPGAFGAYKYSKQLVLFNLNTLLALFVSILLVGLVTNLFLARSVAQIATGLLYLLLYAGTINTVVSSLRRQKVSYGESFNIGLKTYFKLLGLCILMGFAIVVSFILFIIPGLFILPRVVLAPYFLIDQNMGVGDALQAAWDRSKGHALKIWGVLLVNVLFGLLELVLVGFYLEFIYSGAYGVLYGFINKQSAEMPAAPVQPAAPAAPAPPSSPTPTAI